MMHSGFRSVVFIGGGDSVKEDALTIGVPASPLFAVASTGGEAARLLGQRTSEYSGGGKIAESLLREPGSYINLMRSIRDAVR
jgi:hypothetical protein